MRNLLIIAKYTGRKKQAAAQRLQALLTAFGRAELLQTRLKL